MPDDRALGILETRGMASLVQATDAMLKAVDVTVRGRHGIGSGWVTVVVEGEVASVQTAIDIGSREALRHGELITARVIPRPSYESIELMPHWHTIRPDHVAGPSALGILETRGLVPLIQGTDAMVKTAPVDIEGWAYIGGGLVHSVVRGDVASVKDAVKAGGRTAEASGELYATLVIPAPSEGLGPLLPPVGDAETAPESALGVLETTGYVSVITSSDAMVKAADVELVRLSIASGGRVDAIVRGDLDAVQSAIEAGELAARNVCELNGSCVISRPAPEMAACFAVGPGQTAQDIPTGDAMGLIETRSTIGLVKAVDQMLKSAAVRYEGRYRAGYFLTASIIRGEVGAVGQALRVGAVEAEKYGELVSAELIPYPFPAVETCLAQA